MKENRSKEEKRELVFRKGKAGITLIALVVTIIVLLILAGVTISLVVGQNGIITRAQEAKEGTRGASIEEQVAMWKLDKEAGRLRGENYDAQIEETAMIDKLAGQKLLTEGEVIVLKNTVTNPNREITIGGKDISFKLEESSGGNTPDIPTPSPEGPAYIGEELTYKEGSIEEGYVVTDSEGNEYVWIPVENPVAETEAEITIMIAEGKYPMAVKTSGVDSKGKQNYRGVLYRFSLDTKITPNIVKVMPISYSPGGNREPAYLTNDRDGDASSYNTVGITEASLQEEYNEMVERVIANKGFYIGRYEASYNTTTSRVESKTNSLPMTAGDNKQRWYGMYEKQKGTVGNATTHMIWGSQYDQVMIMMKGIVNEGKSEPFYILDSTDMGNYGGSPTNTGINNAYAVKNIYDLAGNIEEWTMEVSTNNGRTIRGGNYGGNGFFNRASIRNLNYSPIGSNSSYGSRSTLY